MDGRTLARLHESLVAAGISCVSVANNAGEFLVALSNEAHRSACNTFLASFDSSDAATVSYYGTQARPVAVALLSSVEADCKLLRAVMLVILDELNLHAAKINAILDAVDAATTLANLKTAVAAIADYPTRTANQVRTAVEGKITAGTADS